MSESSDDIDAPDVTEVLGWFERYYHVLVLAGLVAFMFWSRIRTWDNFLSGGDVLFRGNDPWYHYRQVSYTVEHWPSTMPFDPWTFFPNGNASGQFGTLLDQLIATAALLVGLGNPDQHTVALVTLFAPAVLGTLVAIPVYFMGKRLGGRFGGVVAVTVLALESGRFLSLSLVGFSDHHVAETLFQSLAILGVMVAVSVAARDKPVYEQARSLDADPLRQSLGWAALAGIAITLYLWVWPFGALIIGILGAYFVVQLTSEFLRGESPEHTAFVGAIALLVTAVTVLGSTDTASFTASEFSLLQPAFALAVAGGCIFMAWLARTWEQRGLPTAGYAVAVVGVMVAGILAVMVVLPDVFEMIVNNVIRVFGFWIDPSETGRTVGEVQPLPSLGQLFQSYGFAIIIAAGAALWIVGRLGLRRPVPAEQTLVVVWAFFLFIATMTQQRFEYYLVVPVAVLTGYAISGVFRWLNLSFDPDDVEFYQVISMLAVVMIVVVPLVIGPSTAMAVASSNGPGQDIQAWTEGLDWMQENTPEEGRYADDSSDLQFYGTYERTDDFAYEPGAYGVVSWWDYGHWITQQGHRIPHANPHQQGSNTAANFLLAGSEAQANDVLSGIDENESSQNRYVMADWRMVNTHTTQTFIYNGQRWGNRPNGKFFAPIQFYDNGDVQPSDYYSTLYYNHQASSGQSLGVGTFNYKKQPYYESQVVRLYEFHGSAVEPRPVVLDWDIQELQGQAVPMTYSGTPDEPVLRQFNSMSEARAYVENDSTAQIGGVGDLPSERVPALEHYRLVSTSNMHGSENIDHQLISRSTSVGLNPQRQLTSEQTEDRWTKVFERVDGATIEGTGPANARVRAQVEMNNAITNETFTYHQIANTTDDGSFTMTVPYSTTGDDEWGPEDGRTNVSVRATGEYSFQAVGVGDGNITRWNGSTHVPEAAVIGESDDPVTVDLTEIEDTPEGQQGADADNGTDGSEASENLGEERTGTLDSGTGEGSSDVTSHADSMVGPARTTSTVPYP